MRILALNGASSATGAAFGLLTLTDGTPTLVAEALAPTLIDEALAPGRDGAERLPVLLSERLQASGWRASGFDLIAVVVGPGSFTGLRATLALAHGLALGSPASGSMTEVVGVTVGEALGPALSAIAGGDLVWCVSQARRDRVFIESPDRDGWRVEAAMLAGLPEPDGRVLVGGDAGATVADMLEALGHLVRRSGLTMPSMVAIASAALSRRDGMLPPRTSQPLYVDPPEAKLPKPRAIQAA